MKKICVMIALVTTVLFFGTQVKAQTKLPEPDALVQKLYQELKQKLCENKSKFIQAQKSSSNDGRATAKVFSEFESQQYRVYVDIRSFPSKKEAEEYLEFIKMMVSNAGPSNRLDAFGDVAFASERWIGFVHNTVLVFVTASPNLDFKQERVQEITSDQSIPKERPLRRVDGNLIFNDLGKTSLRMTHPVAREFATYLWEAVINLQK